VSTITIGELAERVGMRTSALRYYEEQGLLTPAGRTDAGYRLYAPEAEQTLRFIQRAQQLGFSLADIGVLLQAQEAGHLDTTAVQVAEARYLALEREITRLLVLRHELRLFLHDTATSRPVPTEEHRPPVESLFDRLTRHTCADTLSRPEGGPLEWLLDYTGCRLTDAEGQRLLDVLRGQHMHLWQREEEYGILVVSDDPAVGEALEAIAQLEATCRAHAHGDQAPELMHNGEGYVLTARGKHAFIFARLFLALERPEGPPEGPLAS